ncbi:MAG: hypothetical protein ABI440_03360 [Casimicrobiaceae bacterium]
MALAGLVGPGLFSAVIAFFIARHRGLQLPGAPSLLASMLMLRAATIAWRATRGDAVIATSA